MKNSIRNILKRDQDNKHKFKFYVFFACVIVFGSISAISFAYFNTKVTGNETSKTDNVKIGEGQQEINFASYLISHSPSEIGTINDEGLMKVSQPATGQTPAQTEYRYSGADVKNYVTFNDETWRIIGVFSTDDGTGNYENRVKIMRDTSIGDKAWDSNNVNEWSTASLKTELNGTYYNGLTTTAKDMIADAKWYTCPYVPDGVTSSIAYSSERASTTEQFGETRNTNWTGKIALAYPSDYGYASSGCYAETQLAYGGYDDSTCYESNWMFSGSYQWLLSPAITSGPCAYLIVDSGYVDGTFHGYSILGGPSTAVSESAGTRPVTYLTSDVSITDGTGTSDDPYIIELGTGGGSSKDYSVFVSAVNGNVSGNNNQGANKGDDIEFTVSPKIGYENGTVKCTNGQHGTLSGDTLTLDNVTANTTCTVTYTAVDYVCNAGKYLKKATTACTACTAGNYCAGGTFNYNSNSDQGINACPTADSGWTATSDTSSEEYNDCYEIMTPEGCASGSVKRTASSASAYSSTIELNSTLKSSVGYYASASATSCTKCSAGYYCPANATSQTACAVGSYAAAGSGLCTACGNGTTTSGTGSTSSSACTTCSNSANVGTWSTQTWSANTVSNLCVINSCPTGYTKTGSSPYTCNINRYTINVTVNNGIIADGGVSSKTVDYNTSTSFTFTPSAGYENLQIVGTCTGGTISGNTLTISNINENQTCTVAYGPKTYSCGGGTYLPSSSTTCTSCTAGSYCPGGNYQFDKTTTQGINECTAGNYCPANAASQTSCPAADSGWTKTSPAGSDNYDDCYETQTPANCSSGTVKRIASSASAYSSTITLTSTLKSNAGYYASSSATSCTQCSAGYYCPANATSQTACAVGSYSGAGSSTCTACDNGKTTSGTGSTSSSACTTCSNNANVSTWSTQTWNANTVSNLCSINKCIANYRITDSACVYGPPVVTVSCTGCSVSGSPKTVNEGQSPTFTITPNNNYVFDSVSCTNDQNGSVTDNVLTVSNVTSDTTCTVTYKTNCVVKGTYITLADGSKKKVENLTGRESLLVWNLETGKYDSAPIVFIDKDPETIYSVMHLIFSDKTNVGIVGEHGFFNYDLGKYIYITENNYKKYIGHKFVKKSTIGWKIVTLTKVNVKKEKTTTYSPVTAKHLNVYANDMLSMPGGIDGMFNIFEVNTNTMKYDPLKKQVDINKYELLDYKSFEGIVSKHYFDVFNGQYLNIAIGKGNLTWENIALYASRYNPME